MKNKREIIRILLIGPLPVLGGGTSVSFNQIVEELSKKHGVSVAVLDTGRKRRDNLFQNSLILLITCGKLFRKISNYDVVSFHASPRGTVYFGPLIYFITRLFKKPLIIREFGGVLDLKYKSKSIINRSSLRIVFKSEKILLQTKKLTNYFKNKFPDSNISWYPTSRPNLLEDKIVKEKTSSEVKFVFLGHVKSSKGIFEIVEAVKLIDSYPFSVDIYGPLKDVFTENDFTSHPKIAYLGFLPKEKVPEMLSCYDVLLLPTYHEGEGYPGVILEAYMAGLPVITTKWISIPEIVADGVSGLLIPPKDPKALADAMESLLTNNKKLNDLKNGTTRYKELFNSEKWTSRFIEICYEALGVRI